MRPTYPLFPNPTWPTFFDDGQIVEKSLILNNIYDLNITLFFNNDSFQKN